MATGPYDVALTLSIGRGDDPNPVYLVGESVPVRISAEVDGDRALATGLRLEVKRPDRVTVVLQGRDLAMPRVNLWSAVVGCDLPGPYALSATCKTPSAARAVATVAVQAAPGDPPPPADGPLILTEDGLPLLTQDARPLTA